MATPSFKITYNLIAILLFTAFIAIKILTDFIVRAGPTVYPACNWQHDIVSTQTILDSQLRPVRRALLHDGSYRYFYWQGQAARFTEINIFNATAVERTNLVMTQTSQIPQNEADWLLQLETLDSCTH